MARKVRYSALESRSARLKLPVRRRPYGGPTLARGVALMFRRNKSNGTWVLKASDGHGHYWTKVIAQSDDYEESNGKAVLTFFEAQDAARKLARGDDGSAESALVTLDSALKAYAADLTARQANAYNAEWPRLHLTSVLLSKPVALLDASELSKWRNGLLAKLAPATVNRLCACISAALELAAQHDERIKNKHAWEVGLASLPGATQARNVIIADDKVRAFVAEAYALDHALGLLSDVLAQTGSRPSQAARLRVEDLHDHSLRPKLQMPKSGKGGGRNRVARKLERYSVSITPALAVRLREAAKGRADNALLLLQSDGASWGDNPGQRYHREVDKIVTAIGLDPAEVSMTALRHSSVVRRLLAHMPVALVGALHNSSEKIIRQHYAKYITEHADDHVRVGLLQDESPTGENVVALAS